MEPVLPNVKLHERELFFNGVFGAALNGRVVAMYLEGGRTERSCPPGWGG